MFSIIEAAGWPIWPLILCSVIALAIIGERQHPHAGGKPIGNVTMDFDTHLAPAAMGFDYAGESNEFVGDSPTPILGLSIRRSPG